MSTTDTVTCIVKAFCLSHCMSSLRPRRVIKYLTARPASETALGEVLVVGPLLEAAAEGWLDPRGLGTRLRHPRVPGTRLVVRLYVSGRRRPGPPRLRLAPAF